MTEKSSDLNLETKRHDVQPTVSQILDWNSEHRRESIHIIYKRAENHAIETIKWYLLSKKPKKNYAQWLRLGTILLTAVAGLLPIISEISELPPIFSSVALGLAALSLAIDKFFGFSSAWMRYIAAEHQIRQCLHEFQMDYHLEQAGWDNTQPTIEQTQKILGRCKTFLYQVDAIIRNETDQWLAEFQDALKQIENGTKLKTEVRESDKPM